MRSGAYHTMQGGTRAGQEAEEQGEVWEMWVKVFTVKMGEAG